MSELVREALHQYIPGAPRSKVALVQELREHFRDTAAELGITSEEDIYRMSGEYRATKLR